MCFLNKHLFHYYVHFHVSRMTCFSLQPESQGSDASECRETIKQTCRIIYDMDWFGTSVKCTQTMHNACIYIYIHMYYRTEMWCLFWNKKFTVSSVVMELQTRENEFWLRIVHQTVAVSGEFSWLFIYRGFLPWGIPKSPWASRLNWPWMIDDIRGTIILGNLQTSIHSLIHWSIHPHLHTHIYIHLHTFTRTYIQPTYLPTYLPTYTYLHILTHTYTYLHILTHTYTYLHAHMLACPHAHMPTCPRACMPAWLHACMPASRHTDICKLI